MADFLDDGANATAKSQVLTRQARACHRRTFRSLVALDASVQSLQHFFTWFSVAYLLYMTKLVPVEHVE